MNKRFLIYFLLILSILSVSNAIIYEDIGNCKILYLNETFYNDQINTTSFQDIIGNITNSLIISNGTFREESFHVLDNNNNIDYTLVFTNEQKNPDNATTFILGEYFSNTQTSYIYINDIYRYNEFKLYPESAFYDLVYNTIKHETTHYIDITLNGFTNSSYTFNINGTSDNVYNTQYFIDIYNDTQISPSVDLIIRDTVNFDGVFSRYPTNKYYNEIVARINALCLYEVQNTIFTYDYLLQPYYCKNFNFYQNDADIFTLVAQTISKQYIFNNNKDYMLIAKKTDGICSVNDDVNGFFGVIDSILNNIINFRISLIGIIIVSLLLGGISFILYGLTKYFKIL